MRNLLTIAMISLAPIAGFAAGSSSNDDSSNDYEKAQDLIAEEDFGAAIPVLEALSEEETNNPDVWNLLGYSYRKNGDLENAEIAYESAISLDPDHLGALEYQGELFLMTGRFDLAEANLAQLRRICDDCEEAEELADAIENRNDSVE